MALKKCVFNFKLTFTFAIIDNK